MPTDKETPALAEELDANPANSSDAADALPAASSAASTENAAPAQTLLDVVKSVVAADAEAPEGSSASDAEKPVAEAASEDAPEGDDENFDGLPFSRHPRFKAAMAQRREFKAQAEALGAEATSLRGPAENFGRIENFMRTNEINSTEMVDLFKFGALFKQDPGKALEMIQPYMAELYSRTGRILPKDLETAVEEGQLSEAHAKELSQQRATAAEAERRATRATTERDQIQTDTANRDRGVQMGAALTDWEAGKKGSDPDFAAKETLIADRCRAIIAAQGQPKSPAEMTAVLDAAHEQVTTHLASLMPQRTEMRRPTTSTNSSVPSAQPKSYLEAVTLAAAKAR